MNDKEKITKIINNINSLSEVVSTLEDATLKAEFTAIINQASIKMERATQRPGSRKHKAGAPSEPGQYRYPRGH